MKHLRLAHKESFKGNHGIPNFRMAAAVVKGGAVLSKACNWDWNHAESRALKRFGTCFEGATIFVARRNMGCSKPCKDCMEKIIEAGISTVVYVNKNGDIIKESVNKYKVTS